MTLPALVAHYKKQELQTQLKKTYSELQQINLRIIADGNDLMNSGNASDRAKLIMSYFNGKNIIGKDTAYTNASVQLTKIYKGKGLYRHDSNYITTTICDNGGVWQDNNGRLWLFNDSDGQICIDINGIKGPNKYGYDFFVFYPQKGKIVPHYTDIENEYHDIAFLDYTYYALIDQDPFNKEKSYWKDYLNLK